MHAREDQKIGIEPNFMQPYPKMAKIRVDNRKGVNFQHWTIWGFQHWTIWEPFGGWEKHGQTHKPTRFMFYKYRKGHIFEKEQN